ncbi:glycyl-tRNA synthetase [Mycoplasma ovis str. Michigan]|uniref:Glycyl-tRNA synthetase n=1 Tax=Mycoplasma ovis str. Michigan TaxID=1415773 RepID=A0ABN4BPS8_9MOLU|nr:His/Gly/Thr/Pro-type tRNA ligase C-terminal domain-containing protein [Mycoplasma ovis]AHC39820.1 glycyl-tRNA synthetase [Mycoplasma ovis str. Michigan]
MSRIEKFLLDNRFIYPSCSIYGGQENSWDYGHLGVLLKENLKKCWMEYFISGKENTVLYEGNLLTNKEIWEATGHIKHFERQLVECRDCNARFEEIVDKCKSCNSGNLTEPKSFNQIFKVEDYYLRPETAQTIFVNAKLISLNSKLKFPFRVAQMGKAFRNEVTTGRKIFRTKEFEQLEFEEFTFPEETESTLEVQKKQVTNFLIHKLGFSPNSFYFKTIEGQELPHYSKKNLDLYYKFEFGEEELWGIANRGDFDLKAHQKHSKAKLHIQAGSDQTTLIPNIVEHSVGLNRLMLAVVTEFLQTRNNRSWEILSLPLALAPYKFAVLPLSSSQEDEAKKLHQWLQKFSISTTLSKGGSIGKRYKEQDQFGTPYCLTVDYDSGSLQQENFSFTIRERDSGSQIRIGLQELKNYVFKCLNLKELISKHESN